MYHLSSNRPLPGHPDSEYPFLRTRSRILQTQNSFLKDSFLTAKLNNVIREIVIPNAVDYNLDLHCNLEALKYHTRKEDVGAEHLLQRLEEEIKELAEDHAKQSQSHFALEKRLNQEAISITQHEIDSMSGFSPAHENHLTMIGNNAIEI